MERDFTERELDRIIEMAWEDRTPFEAIEFQFNISEDDVIKIMQRELKPSSFRMWRARVQGRKTKHLKLRGDGVTTFKSKQQKHISQNKLSKR